MNITELREQLRRFVAERDWDQFHSPKNLSMALSVEVAELMEHFQWATQDETRNLDKETRAEVTEELADILIYLVRLADKLDVDLDEAVRSKMQKNEQKYPAEQVRGSAAKYTAYAEKD